MTWRRTAVVLLALALSGCITVTPPQPAGQPVPPASTAPQSAAAPASTLTPSTSAPPVENSAGPSTKPSAEPSAETSDEPASLKEAQRRVRDGVIRLEVTTCQGGSTGTGFAISDSLLVTAAHVVEGAAVIRVIEGTTSRAGEIVGLDRGADVALVRAKSDLEGHQFEFSERSPEEADQVGILGYPRGEPLNYTQGEITSKNRKVEVEGYPRYGLLQTSARAEPGNSGGPMFESGGSVVGVVSAGVKDDPEKAWAVSNEVAEPLIEKWRRDAEPVDLDECDALAPTDDTATPEVDPTSQEFQAFSTLNLYFVSINQGDYPTALAQLADNDHIDVDRFGTDVSTSMNSDFEVGSVETSDDGPVVWLMFTSRQAAGKGPKARPDETCTRWSQDYTFTNRRGLWLIDSVTAHDGRRNSPC